MPRVSVVVPVFNAVDSIRQCALSIFNQTFSDFEILFVNDGSTDNSAAELEKFKLTDHRVKIYHQENKGTGEARNTGIREAKGEFICFLDSDDTVEPQMLADLVSEASEGVDIVVCDFNEVSVNGKIRRHCYTGTSDFSGYFKAIISFRTASAVWAKLYRRTLFDNEACLFPFNLRNNEDNATLFKLLFFGRNIHFVPKALYNWNRCLDSKSRTINKLRIQETIEVLCQRKEFLQSHDIFKRYIAEYYEGVIYTFTLRISHIKSFAHPDEKVEYTQYLLTCILDKKLIDRNELLLLRNLNIFDYWRFVFFALHERADMTLNGYQQYFGQDDWNYALKCCQSNGQPEINSLAYHLKSYEQQPIYVYGIGESWLELQKKLSPTIKIAGYIDRIFKDKCDDSCYDLDSAMQLIPASSVIVIVSVAQTKDMFLRLRRHSLYQEKKPTIITYVGIF